MAELIYQGRAGASYICQYKRWNSNRGVFEYYTVYSDHPCGATGEQQAVASINNSSNIRGEIRKQTEINNLINK